MKRVEWIRYSLLALLVGCSTIDDDLGKEQEANNLKLLSVDMPVDTRAEITSIDKVKIYAMNYPSAEPYPSSDASGVVYEYKDLQWQTTTELELTDAKVTIFACSPSSEAITTINSALIGGYIAVTLNPSYEFSKGDQIDYLYATPVEGVLKTNKAISLTMNHALSKVSFRVEKAQAAESDEIILKKLEIVSATNRLQSGVGRMQLKDGGLVGLTDRKSISLVGNLPLVYPQSTPNITSLLAPMTAPESILSFKVTVIIDGNERVFETQVLPTVQSWKAGEHYVYHILVNKISADLSGIQINKWGSDANQDTNIGI